MKNLEVVYVEIDTQWNVNMLVAETTAMGTFVEIDTQWNVNKYSKSFNSFLAPG